MTLSSGIKFRCYPTEKQKRALSQWMGCQRLIYNAKVAEDEYFRTFNRKFLLPPGNKRPIDQQYAHFKSREHTPYLYEVPSQILRNGATRFKQAYSRFFQGLAGRPVFKKKYRKQSVWITSELFKFIATGKSGKKRDRTIYDHKLMIGKGKHNLGELVFKASDEYDLPATITISKEAGKWFLSFSYEKDVDRIPEQELIDYYASLSRELLTQITQGHDRGTVIPVATDTGKTYDFTGMQKKRMIRKERRKKHYQKMMAKRKPGSRRRKRASLAAVRCSRYAANVRNDFAHQTSRRFVNSDREVFVFEDLATKNMTKAPKPKKGNDGTYLPNGARAKAGLNKAILESAWGKVRLFTSYKAARVNKLVIGVPPHHTSQECSRCSHTHPDNRLTQAVFACKNCGFTEHADVHAAIVVKMRGIRMLRAGEVTVKASKKMMRLKKKVSLGQELADAMRVGEGYKTDCGDTCSSLPSMIRETPATTVLTV